MDPVKKITLDNTATSIGEILVQATRELKDSHDPSTLERQPSCRHLTIAPATCGYITRLQAEHASLIPVTFENRSELSTSGYTGFSTGHALPKQFLNTYFELLESGKLPTAKLIAKKLSKNNPKISASTIEEIKINEIDPAFCEAGYQELSLFPDGTALLASVWSAYRDLKSEGGIETLTLDKLCSHIGSTTLAGLVNGLVGIKKDLSTLVKLDPDFGRIFEGLQFDALGCQIEREDKDKAIKNAHNWIPGSETLDLTKKEITDDLLYDEKSLFRCSSTAGEYLNLLNERLTQTVNEKFSESSFIKARKLLFNVLSEKGLTEQNLIVGWCYWNVRGEGPYANMKKLIEVASHHTSRPLDFDAVNNALIKLENFSEGLSFPTDLTHLTCEEVKKRIVYGQDSYNSFLHTILENLSRKQDFQGINLNEEMIQAQVERNLGLTGTDYAIYKACQHLGSNDGKEGKTVKISELTSYLEKNYDLKLEPQSVRERLTVIERVTFEKFNLTELNTTKYVPRLKDLDLKAKLKTGAPIFPNDPRRKRNN